jgi:hypothetical protein
MSNAIHNDNETVNLDSPSHDVLDCMFSWHGGQGSMLYAAASCWLAGRTVTRETAQAALDELSREQRQPHFTEADAEALLALEEHVEQSA